MNVNDPVNDPEPRSPERDPALTLLTRPGCHLCDEMASVLDAVLPDLSLDYAVRNVDSDPALARRFGDVVPVLLRDGRPVAKVRIDERRLRRIVRG